MSITLTSPVPTQNLFQKTNNELTNKPKTKSSLKLHIHISKNGSFARVMTTEEPKPEIKEKERKERKEPSIRKRKLCTEKLNSMKRVKKEEKKDEETVSPIFFSPLDREFCELLKEYSFQEDWAEDQAKFQRSVVKYSGVSLMKSYLNDFWRHELEKSRGKKKMWDEITGFSEGWWKDEEPSSIGVKTRWQEVGENFFRELLGLGEVFDATNAHHLKLLAGLSQRAQKEGDTILQQIIWNYMRTLE